VQDPLTLHSDAEVAAMRRRAVSKAAWRFLPILTIAYILNYLDRTSVGIAALTMNRDLGLTAYQFGWGAGLLFASYSVFEIPSNLILYRFGARRWIARIMITWGLAGLAGWQWMFIVEGLPASIVGFFILRMLSDRPEEAEWLSVEERAAMVAMRAEEQRDRARHS
jgi:sugar phosphate permease